MRLNNKGMSMIELIVSIALMSVVMLFMYKMLSDITFEKDNDYFASLNQEQRVEIIDKVHTTINDNIEKISGITTTASTINFNSASGGDAYHLKIENDMKQITFYEGSNENANNIIGRWVIKGGTLGLPSCSFTSNLYECQIPIYTESVNNKKINSIDNNNTIDDLIFAFKLSE